MEKILLLAYLVICTIAEEDVGRAKREVIEIDYTVKNLITGDDRVFQASLFMNTEKRPFHNIMDEAALLDNRFRYETNHHEEFGHYVIEVNGLREDIDGGYFWALMKLDHPELESHCLLSHAGVSYYEPYDGEHIALVYETFDVFDLLPECPIQK